MKNDPREIVARFETECAETGAPIKKGDRCVYYPTTRRCFHVDSNQAREFRDWRADLDLGHDY